VTFGVCRPATDLQARHRRFQLFAARRRVSPDRPQTWHQRGWPR